MLIVGISTPDCCGLHFYCEMTRVRRSSFIMVSSICMLSCRETIEEVDGTLPMEFSGITVLPEQ